MLNSEKGTWRIGTAPDCRASYACVPGSNPADQRNILVSPFLMSCVMGTRYVSVDYLSVQLSSLAKRNEMNGVLGHLCAHVG